MARAIPTSIVLPADELRHLLTAAENRSVNVRGLGPEAARELLTWFDRIAALFPALEAEGAHLEPERVRWEAVQAALRRHAAELLIELKPLGGLAAVRRSLPAPPPEEAWWWWLDRARQRRLRRQLLSVLAVFLALAALLAGGYWLFNRLFPVDPTAATVYRYKLEGQTAIAAGDLTNALAAFEAAAATAPDDLETQAWLAALYDVLGRESEASTRRERLQQTVAADPAQAAVVNDDLAAAYLALGRPETALALVQEVLAAHPDRIQTLLLAGSVYESLGRIDEAMATYEQAAAVAAAQNKPEQLAVARIRLAQLLQARPFLPTPTPVR
ncbi:MAG: tetratricopeptide repeat protein [Caldilineales bacterium]|nr:tetratricopeptide repeat protein [Caldilineales bacterium]